MHRLNQHGIVETPSFYLGASVSVAKVFDKGNRTWLGAGNGSASLGSSRLAGYKWKAILTQNGTFSVKHFLNLCVKCESGRCVEKVGKIGRASGSFPLTMVGTASDAAA